MTINPLLRTLAAQSAGQIVACHQVTYSVLRTLKTGRVGLADSLDSAIFCSELGNSRSRAKLYNPRRPSPVEPLSVFGYAVNLKIEHSNTVVEVSSGSITVAEQPIIAREISFRSLAQSLEEWVEGVDAIIHFPPRLVAEVMDSIPGILAREEVARGAEAWDKYRREFNEQMARESAVIDALIRSRLGL